MSEDGTAREGQLAGWDPRRRAALEAVWDRFERAVGDKSLSEELVDERRRKAAAEDTWFAG